MRLGSSRSVLIVLGADSETLPGSFIGMSLAKGNRGRLERAPLDWTKFLTAPEKCVVTFSGSRMATMPDRTEAAEYYFVYIDQVPDGDICSLLHTQGHEVRELLRGVTEDRSLRSYAPGKWSIREVVNHLIDTERLFVFRAFWFARGFESPLPSFDQTIAASTARANDRTLADLSGEFDAVRTSTTAFFRSLPAEAWERRGVASDNPFTVCALAYLAAGHVTHHVRIVRERYPGA